MASVLRRVSPRAVLMSEAVSTVCRRIRSDERLALLSTAASHRPRGDKEQNTSYKFGLLLGLGSFCLYSLLKEREDIRVRGIFQTAGCTASESGNNGAGGKQRRSDRYNFLVETVEKVSPSLVYIEHKVFHSKLERIIHSGSGFIISEGQYVLTNAHVVRSAQSVTIQLHDGRKLTGTVTDTDQVADLALVKLNLPKGSEPLPSLDFGSSASLRPGEWVIALGSPLFLSNTITAGVVSSVHRPTSEMILDQRLQTQKPDMEYVQTDAAILPGNSGGPLVNLDGEVIGINVLIAGPGISFAVPSDFAKEFLERANKKTSSSSGYGIGISMLTISPAVRPHIQNRFTSFEVSHGVLIVEVWRDSPADTAGLRKNDIVIEMNSKEVTSSQEIFQEVQNGKTVEFVVLRGSEKIIIRVEPEPFESK